MFLAGLDDDLGVADLLDLGGDQGAEFLAGLGRDAAGAAVGHDAVGVQGAEVGAGGDITGSQFKPETEGLDDAASDLEFDGVITEEAEVPRSAARGDTRGEGEHASLRGVFAQGVEVRG